MVDYDPDAPLYVRRARTARRRVTISVKTFFVMLVLSSIGLLTLVLILFGV